MSSIQISSQVRATLTSFWNQQQVLETASHPGKVTRTWTLAHMCIPSFGHHISHRCDQLTARIYLKELYNSENIQLLQVKIHNIKIHKLNLRTFQVLLKESPRVFKDYKHMITTYLHVEILLQKYKNEI